MSDYYNDNDPFVAAWLRRLIAAGQLPEGKVDERDIREIDPGSLAGYRRCHFFAGIGGWAYALALAGWPDDRPVWTGSCPCEPISCAGQRAGHADQRHLWPAFFRLIAERRPASILGEQVASGDGREWLAAVRYDLERLGYAIGAADLPAAGCGAPHIRQRLYWLADAGSTKPQAPAPAGPVSKRAPVERGCSTGRGGGAADGFWRETDWLLGQDGQWRPVAPGTCPLAHGVPARVGRLRGYGGAVVPQTAAAFARAYLEVSGALDA